MPNILKMLSILFVQKCFQLIKESLVWRVGGFQATNETFGVFGAQYTEECAKILMNIPPAAHVK